MIEIDRFISEWYIFSVSVKNAGMFIISVINKKNCLFKKKNLIQYLHY